MIGAKRVTAPDGTTWRVGRRWFPDKPVLWRRKRRRRKKHGDRGGAGDWLPDFGLEAIDEGFLIVLALIAFVLLFVLLTTVVFPIIVFGIELLLVAVLLVGTQIQPSESLTTA